MKEIIDKILFSSEVIQSRIREIVGEIDRDFKGRDLVIIAVLNGSVVFLADLVRGFTRPLAFDFIGVSSYEGGFQSLGVVKMDKEIGLDIKGKSVLVVDDILDTGRTLSFVKNHLQKFHPRKVKICVLLEKRRRRAVKVKADYVGFRIPDVFVFGYGLDYINHYRHLPYIATLRKKYQDLAMAGKYGYPTIKKRPPVIRKKKKKK